MTKPNSGFWADEIAAQVIKRSGNCVICTGITPSGQIHIGNLREVLSGDVVYRSLLEAGHEARLIFLADTYDALRRVYPFLDKEIYEPLVGKPLSEIPCPCGEHESYAAHFLDPFLNSLDELGFKIEIKQAHEMYKNGEYRDAIFTALEQTERIAAILHRITGKEIDDSWSPANPKCEVCGRITKARVSGFNRDEDRVDYHCDCGHQGQAKPSQGEVKLTWRVDWPARWQILGVTVEPFGKDHASRGGSYDSGVAISREIFDYEPPLPVVYEWISLKGRGDMSSSKGNVVSVAEMVEVVPPDVLRYLVFRNQPKKALSFDPGLPLLTLIDELDDLESKSRDQRAAELSLVSGMGSVGIPFKHLVSIVQIAGEDDDEAVRIIKRGGYSISDQEALIRRMAYARKWLKDYAPEELKFQPQKSLPAQAQALPLETRRALAGLAARLKPDLDGDQIHGLFYEVQGETGIEASRLFKGFYLALIGKERGPRAGWFVLSLGLERVKTRLQALVAES